MRSFKSFIKPPPASLQKVIGKDTGNRVFVGGQYSVADNGHVERLYKELLEACKSGNTQKWSGIEVVDSFAISYMLDKTTGTSRIETITDKDKMNITRWWMYRNMYIQMKTPKSGSPTAEFHTFRPSDVKVRLLVN